MTMAAIPTHGRTSIAARLKLIILRAAALASFAGMLCAIEPTPLRVIGTELRTDGGQGPAIRLRGVNLGGWFLQEHFMSPLPARWDEHRARSTLLARFGPARARALLDAYQEAWIADDDFARIASEGLNCVRLPLYWRDLLPIEVEEPEAALPAMPLDFSRLDRAIQSARAHGLLVIIDLHGAPGSQNGRDHSGDQRTAGLWSSPAAQMLCKRIWREIALRYRDEHAVAAYDLLNEAARDAKAKRWDATIIAFVSELYAEVRAVDPHRPIIFSVWSEYYHVGDLLTGKENYLLAYHWYVYPSFLRNEGTEADFWRGRILDFASASRARYPAPVMVGEFSFRDDPALWPERMALMENADLHWTKWSYKTRGGRGWGLYEARNALDHAVPDLERDDEATIHRKWTSWRTDSPAFIRNEEVRRSWAQVVGRNPARAEP